MSCQRGVLQELREQTGWVTRQSFEHILQVGGRDPTDPFAAAHEAVEDRRRAATAIATDEHLVLPIMRRSA